MSFLRLIPIALFGAAALAQSSGVLAGLIVNSSGEPLRNARIVLVSADGATRRETTTDDLNLYAFSLLPAGDYHLEAPGRKLPSRPICLKADEKRAWRLVWDDLRK